jgi:hypothetical protein
MTPASEDGEPDRDAPLPWHDWAGRLSLAYGWTPQQLGQMTVAQLWIYLNNIRGDTHGSGGRKRMSPGEARDFCQRRQTQKQQWIDKTMKEIARGR